MFGQNNTITICLDQEFPSFILKLYARETTGKTQIILTRNQETTSFTENNQEFLTKTIKKANISVLTINSPRMINNDFATFLVKEKCALKIFRAPNQMLSDASLQTLLNDVTFKKSIQTLNVNDNHMAKAHLVFNALFQSPSLTTVDLSNNTLSLGDYTITVPSNCTCPIKFLNISGNQFTGKDLLNITSALAKLPLLEELKICSTHLPEGIGKALCKIKNLKKLDITHCYICQKDIDELEKKSDLSLTQTNIQILESPSSKCMVM